MTGFEFPRALTFERMHHYDLLSEDLREKRFKQGLQVTFDEYQAALIQLTDCRRWLADAFKNFDVILTPSAPDEAPKGLEYTGAPCFNIFATWPYTPGVTLPTSTGPNGLPIGVQFMGPHRQDIRVLEAAKAAFPILDEG